MNKLQTITTDDGFTLPVYLSQAIGEPKGGIVLIQEIFGITEQLCDLADDYAAQGYSVIVPALFARVSDQLVLDYSEAQQGLELVSQLQQNLILSDIQTSAATLNHSQVTVIGFCWGGGLAYLAASELNLHSGVAFYGTRLVSYLPRKPQCPFQFHFGESDKHSPPELIQQMQENLPECEFYLYAGVGHAFANQHKASFNQDATRVAQQRVLKMLSA